jgi:hypothetical protein
LNLYYADQRGPDAEGVATQLARQLADPRPADQRTVRQRLSTYLSGRVTPSAALMLRMRRVAAQAQASDNRQPPNRD